MLKTLRAHLTPIVGALSSRRRVAPQGESHRSLGLSKNPTSAIAQQLGEDGSSLVHATLLFLESPFGPIRHSNRGKPNPHVTLIGRRSSGRGGVG